MIIDRPEKKKVAVVRVPSVTKDKYALFEVFKRTLDFPSYFGENWDAFEECINDLAWLPENMVLIIHDENFQMQDGDFRVYFDILRKSAAHWTQNRGLDLVIVFGEKVVFVD